MRSGGQEFEAHALAFVSGVAEKHDAAFLLFLGERIGENDHCVHAERLIEVQQAAMRIDDNRFAGLAEAAAVGILSRCDHAHPHENAGTPSGLVDFHSLCHGKSMLRQFPFRVNETILAVFLQRKLSKCRAVRPLPNGDCASTLDQYFPLEVRVRRNHS